MKAMIFAAGLGSRLKPLTDTMPKALVPIAGRPMLEHVILKLKAAGFTEIVINIHHFGEQILDFLKANENFGHLQSGAVATLLASQRKTSRYLLFDTDKRLCGWINKDTEQVKPEGFQYDPSLYQEYAFSGIHVLSPAIFRLLDVPCWEGKFSIMDFYLATCRQVEFSGYLVEDLRLIDIGKPETLAKAEGFCTGTLHSDA